MAKKIVQYRYFGEQAIKEAYQLYSVKNETEFKDLVKNKKLYSLLKLVNVHQP